MTDVKLQSSSGIPEDKQRLLIDFWNNRKDDPPRLKEMIELVFGPGKDGRTAEGMMVKRFLVERGIKPLPSQTYVSKVAQMQLREDQKDFIGNNVALMTPTDLAKVLFKNPKLSNLSAEVKLVEAYVRSLPTEMKNVKLKPVDESFEYKPPKTFEQSLARINRYVFPNLDKNKLTNFQKKQIRVTMAYLHNFRFGFIMKQLPSPDHRELMESSFIDYVHDKEDLNAEELNLYMNLALDIVNLQDTQQIIHQLTELQKQCAVDSEGKKLSMSLAEAIHHAQGEYNQNKSRQHKLAQDLAGKRAERLDLLVKKNASILNLVELWTEEKEREKMIKLAQMLEQRLADEIDSLTSVDDLKARVYGISKAEVLGFEE